jgi:hypothetical protein
MILLVKVRALVLNGLTGLFAHVYSYPIESHCGVLYFFLLSLERRTLVLNGVNIENIDQHLSKLMTCAIISVLINILKYQIYNALWLISNREMLCDYVH